MTGTAAGELIADVPGAEGPNNTINGNDGNDLIFGDSDALISSLIGQGNISIATAQNIDASGSWSTSTNNPMIAGSAPHTTLYVEPGAGQQRFFAVTLGAGQTLTLDVDFTFSNQANWGMGTTFTQVPTALAVLDAGGTVLASAAYSVTADFGSTEAIDSTLVFTAGAAGTYYIRLSELESNFADPGAFEGGEQVLLNVSATGHAATATPLAAGNDVINGGNGADTILGMFGTDSVHGEFGGDIIYSTGFGSYWGDEDNDTIYASSNGTSEALDGGTGIDVIDTTSSSFNYVIDLATGVTNVAGEAFTNFEQLRSGAGNDTISGTALANYILTGDGNDTVHGGDGSDFLVGGKGSDFLYGEAGPDTLSDGYNPFGTDVDTLDAGDGDDIVYFENGTQNGGGAHGGTGTDALFIYNVAAGDVTVQLDGVTTHGADVMATDGFESFTTYSYNNFTVIGTAVANSITTSNGNDVLNGSAGADTINSGIGNDTLIGGTGIDTLIGGQGDDWYYVDNAADVVTEAAGEGTNDRVLAGASYVLAAGAEIERLTTDNNTGTAAINLTGNALANTVYGNAGTNTLDGGAGADTMVGLGGDDLFIVDNVADVVAEGAAEGALDRIYSSVSYTLGAGVYVERLQTTNNAGTTALQLAGNALANTIYGNAGANVLDGKAGNDTLVGLAGDDALVGGLGNDAMIGGLGDDWYYVDSLSDVVTEAAGEGANDRIFAGISYTLGASVHVERLTTDNSAGTGAINLTGNGFVNVIYGNAGANILDGRGGADTLLGLGGDDTYFVDNAADVVVEGAAEGALDRVLASVSYTLGAGVYAERLTTDNNAGTAAINLTGNALANLIYGNAGANILDGKGGADTLVGLAGADSFAFTTALGGGNVDAISGFVVADDTIRLENAVFTGLAAGALAAGAFATGAAATQADDRIVYNSATGALLFDADGVGGAAAVQFATLAGGLALTSADFLVV